MRDHLSTAAALAIAAVVIGCGSSSKSPSTTAASSPSGSAGAQSQAATTATGATGTGTAAITISVKHNKLGRILAAGPKRLTVYLFEGDRGTSSSCSGACAGVWPPVTSTGGGHAGAGAIASNLGTVARPDGTMQLTYKGHPLYYYARDGDSGDAYGQALKSFGAEWYVLAPRGDKVDSS